jgi:hypothetical protein
MTAEASSRVAGDASVAAAASTALATAETSINTAMTAEASSRVAGDVSLAAAIDLEKGRIDAILDGSDVDLDQFAEIVSFVNGIDLENDNALLSAVTSIGTAIGNEESSRVSGDASLNDSIGSLQTDLFTNVMLLNSAITAEESSRIAADGSLESFLNGKINTEVSSRESADESLFMNLNDKINTQISAEASTRLFEDEKLQEAIDAEGLRAMSAEASLEAALSTEVAYLISNTDLTAIDSFTEVADKLDQVANTYMKKVSVSGMVNGTNKVFTFASILNGSDAVYYNGLLQEAGVDYTIGSLGDSIEFTDAPKAGSKVVIYGVY